MRIVTVASGVTVPSASMVIGICPVSAAAARTVCGGGADLSAGALLLLDRAGRDLFPARPDQDRDGGQHDGHAQPQPGPRACGVGGCETGAAWRRRLDLAHSGGVHVLIHGLASRDG